MVYIVQKIKRIHRVYAVKAMEILAGIIIFIGITSVLNKMYVNYSDSDDAWWRTLWYHFYENEGNIDNIYLGSSHVFWDINPEILDQLTGKCNFNLATHFQSFKGSYYLLREADNRNQLSHVYLEMYYGCNQNDRRLNEYQWNWNNTDHMKWSFTKVAYMASIGDGSNQYINILFPYTRYRKYLGDWEYIKNTLSAKQQEDYRSYRWESMWEKDNGRLMIREKGFLESTQTLVEEKKCFSQQINLSESCMGEQSERYFRKVIEYCQKQQLPITLFVSPSYDLELISTQDYDDYIKEVRELAAGYGLVVYDFNLVKEEYLPFQDSKYFNDPGHLNCIGAEFFTPFFYQVVSGEEADNQKFFYDSYQEKLRKLSPTVYGVYYISPTEQEQMKTLWVASNRDSDMEYRIILTPDEGKQYMIQDFQENKEFSVSAEEHGICTLVARMKEIPNEIVQTMEIRY